ncbi:hypothetical protein Aperf_G00000070772 [Anoplocephala perfoliata]
MSLGGRNCEAPNKRSKSTFSMSPKENECIEKFLSLVGTSSAVIDNDVRAFRFLAARKFNIQEAVDLFHSYEAFLKSEGITLVDPFEEGVRRELLSGKFTILNDNDAAGARVAQFFVRLHRPTKSTHKAFLQSVMFQLNAALRKETAVRNGIILIYDMTNSKYSNFDADLFKKLFNMLKSCYPIRLRRIIVLTAPLWFRAPFQLLRVFIKEELRDRVHVLRPSPGSRLASLSNPDPIVAQKDHFAWLHAALSETPPFTTTNPNELFNSSCSQGVALRQPAAVSAFFDVSNDGGGTDSNNNTIDRSGRSSSSVSDTGDEISGLSASSGAPLVDDESLMAEIGCCSPNWDPFALSSSQSSDAESCASLSANIESERVPKNNVMSMSCSPVLSAPTIANATAANGDVPIDKTQDANTEGTPTPPAVPKFASPLNNFHSSRSDCDPTSATTPTVEGASSSTQSLSVQRGSLHNYLGSSNVVSSGQEARQAPLATQDDFISPTTTSVEDSNTIRKEKRSKPALSSISLSSSSTSSHSLGPRTIIHPSDLIPSWALNRPSGPPIHEGPMTSSTTSPHGQEDPQSEKFYCSGEPSPPVTNSPHRLRSQILQSPGVLTSSGAGVTQVDGFVKSGAPDHEGSEGDVEGDQEEEETMEVDEDEEHYDDDDNDDDDSDEGDEAMDLDMDSLWMTPDQLVNHVADVGVNGLVEEYSAIGSIKINDPCTAFRRPCNSSKNRYVDVTCLEHSRVQLRAHENIDSASQAAAAAGAVASGGKAARTEKQVPIYIHANWVDSYRQRNAFICTQGPLQDTAGDFWFMIWTYHVPAIVMITRCYESQRCKCFQYWPAVEGQSLRFTTISPSSCSVVTTGSGWAASSGSGGIGNSGTMGSGKKKSLYGLARRSASEVSNSNKFVFEVTHLSSQPIEDYTCTKLQLKDVKSGQSRMVEHFAFHSWPDHGVPSDSSALLELLSTVQNEYASTIKRELGYTSSYDTPIPPPPIVVHCSAGIGRTGTFIALDVSTKQLLELGKVNVPLTVSRIRSQRSGCVQVSAQYLFVYRALIDFALARGIVSPAVSAAVAVAQRQLSASTQPSMVSMGPAGATGSIPMDASLLSVLAAATRGGSGSNSSSGNSDTASFGALMRLVRSYMTSSRGGGGTSTEDKSRISTELDFEREATQAVAMAASEKDEIESIGDAEEENVGDDEEPKLPEIPPGEEERMQIEQNETPSVASTSAPISTNDAVPASSSNNEKMISTTSPNVPVVVEESAAV